MQDVSPWITLVIGVIGSGGLVTLLGYWFNRKRTSAETGLTKSQTILTDTQSEKTEAETTKIIQQAAGELIDDLREYYIFDILEIPTGSITHKPLRKRLELLEGLRSKLAEPVHVITSFYGEDKKRMIRELKESNKEGVIFKHLEAPYIEGRNKKNLKFKFTKHVDCVIIDRNIDSKDNFALGMFNGSELEEVGHCSALTGDGPKLKIGDVVQVNILYATEDKRLYQPVKPKLRIDKRPEDCIIDQLNSMLPDRQVVG